MCPKIELRSPGEATLTVKMESSDSLSCLASLANIQQQFISHQGNIFNMMRLILTFIIALSGCLSEGKQFGSLEKPATAAREYFNLDADGSSLDVFHICNPLADPTALNKYPVLYGHGLLFDASSMLSRGEHSRPRKPVIGRPTIKYPSPGDRTDDTALPFALSNNNFDVWMFDARGSSRLNRNQSVQIDSAKSHKFWDFSLDEQGLQDLPKLIDFVLGRTGAPKLIYISYSESSLFMFELLSSMPEYSDKLVAFVAMAPVAYVGHVSGLAPPVLAPILAIPDFLEFKSIPEPILETFDNSLRGLCKYKLSSELFCAPIINGIGGTGNSASAPSFYSHLFHSTSLKAIKHFLQLFIGKRFAMYDFGPIGNMAKYGSPRNPDYKLERIRSNRIILVRGQADILSTPKDQEHLLRDLRVRPFADIILENYNHFDFIDGKDVISKVNQPVIEILYKILYLEGPDIIKDPMRSPTNLTAASIKPLTITSPTTRGSISAHAQAQSVITNSRAQQPTSFLNSFLKSPAQEASQNMNSVWPMWPFHSN